MASLIASAWPVLIGWRQVYKVVKEFEPRPTLGTSFREGAGPASLLVFNGLLGKRVQPAGPNVFPNLPIPRILMASVADPLGQLQKFLCRQPLDCLLDFLHRAHGPNLP
jgi:hypothetical protein